MKHVPIINFPVYSCSIISQIPQKEQVLGPSSRSILVWLWEVINAKCIFAVENPNKPKMEGDQHSTKDKWQTFTVLALDYVARSKLKMVVWWIRVQTFHMEMYDWWTQRNEVGWKGEEESCQTACAIGLLDSTNRLPSAWVGRSKIFNAFVTWVYLVQLVKLNISKFKII